MSTELSDFTTAPAWQDDTGDVYVRRGGLWDHWTDRAVDANELRSWAPWTPLDTADEWVRRIDSGKLADVINSIVAPDDLTTEHIERMMRAADAVLAALPDLMGGAA